MKIYRVSARKIDGFSILLNSCIENDINFRKFSLTNEVSDLELITAEIETEALHYDLMKFLENHKAENGFPEYWKGPILKNIENELKIARTIVSTVKTEEDFKKVEDQLSEFHGHLLAFFEVHEEINCINELSFTFEFEWLLFRVINFFSILENQPGMKEISDRITKIFEGMMKAYANYQDAMRRAEYVEEYAEMVEEAAADDLEERLSELTSEYSILTEEFLEKLDEFIGENTFFKLPEKGTA